MTKQYTSEKAKRIMEIAGVIQKIDEDNKDNPIVKQMCDCLVEIANMATEANRESIQLNTKCLQVNEDINGLMCLFHSYLDSKDQIEDFQEFTESKVEGGIQ